MPTELTLLKNRITSEDFMKNIARNFATVSKLALASALLGITAL